MNRRQLAFAREYAVDHNGAAAAVRAGYAQSRARITASELLRRPDVMAELARLGASVATVSDVTREWFLDEFLGYHQGAKEGRYPASVGIRGLEAAAKMTGNMVERSESASSGARVFTLNFDRDLEAEPEEPKWGP